MKPLTGNDPVGSETHCIDQLMQCVGLQWVIMAHLILFCIYSTQGPLFCIEPTLSMHVGSCVIRSSAGGRNGSYDIWWRIKYCNNLQV